MTQIVDFGRPKLNGIAPGLVAGQLLGASQLSELFLRRVSPALVDGKAELGEIRGKSIVWNQLVKGGNFASAEDWIESNCSLSVENNVATATATTSPCSFYQYLKITSGHKYLFFCSVKASNDSMQLRISNSYGGSDVMAQKNTSWQRLSTIWTSNESGDLTYPRLYASDIQEDETFDVRDVMLIDLTLLGLGDLTAAQFSALYRDAYYPYAAPLMKNNDADAIESVGFNQWDEVAELGRFDTTTGANIAATDQIRTKNLIKVLPDTDYYCKGSAIAGADVWAISYDDDGNVISGTAWGAGTSSAGNCHSIGNHVFHTATNAALIKFYVGTPYGAVYKNDICINISRSDLNGTYRPHQANTVHLGLDALRVPSHNLWDEEWEEGGLETTEGKETSTAGYCRNKGYVAVTPETVYYIKAPVSMQLLFYAEDQSYLGYSTAVGDIKNATFTTPEGAYFMRFRNYVAESWAPYQNDICINLSDAAFNGLYEPYGEDGVRTVNGLDGVGTAYDSVKGWKLGKRMWEVDLGSLEWVYAATYGFYSNALQGLIKRPSGNGVAANILSTSLLRGSFNEVYNAGTSGNLIGVNADGLVAANSSLTDSGDFKAAMAGVKLRFELATPIEYDLIGIIPGHRFEGFAGGAEFVISPEDAETPSAPFIGEFSYPESAVRGVITEEVFKEFLEALGTAMGGTWTMTYDASTKTYSFSFTS